MSCSSHVAHISFFPVQTTAHAVTWGDSLEQRKKQGSLTSGLRSPEPGEAPRGTAEQGKEG